VEENPSKPHGKVHNTGPNWRRGSWDCSESKTCGGMYMLGHFWCIAWPSVDSI